MANDTRDLQKALSDISNYIYVNDGVLKDRVFSDVVRLIALKLKFESKGTSGLLGSEHLAKVPALEVDRWAKELLEFGVQEKIEDKENARWNIKQTSVLWAAKQLSKFSFSDFPADVKGEAFQALVVNNLRGDRGEYFTPQPLVSAISEMASLTKGTRVIDPACGSGGFLYGAFRAGVRAWLA
jgi:type I restriction enzyme M protein